METTVVKNLNENKLLELLDAYVAAAQLAELEFQQRYLAHEPLNENIRLYEQDMAKAKTTYMDAKMEEFARHDSEALLMDGMITMKSNFYCPCSCASRQTCKLKSATFVPTDDKDAVAYLPWCPYYTFELIKDLCEEQ